MNRYLAVKMYEGEFANYDIEFMAIPLTQEAVGLLASKFASCQPAFEAGAYQVKFFESNAGVVDYWNAGLDVNHSKWLAIERIATLLDDCAFGVVIHLSEESQGLFGYYRHQMLTIDSDGDIGFVIASRDGPWVDSAKVPLERLKELVSYKDVEEVQDD